MFYSKELGSYRMEVNSYGAELSSLKKDGVEYLWTADKNYWGEHGPVLFPFIGRLKNGVYRYDGKTYAMTPHGFAKRSEFTLTKDTEDTLRFTLEDSPETYENYPFHFRFHVEYTLSDKGLAQRFIVENTDNKEIYFSVGGHPGFLMPPAYTEGKDRTDCRIAVLKNGQRLAQFASTAIVEEGLAASASKEPLCIRTDDGLITPTIELFAHDALVIENHDSDEVDFIDPDGKVYVRCTYSAPLVGIWSMYGKLAPYVCIEPWYGRCDREDFAGELSEREWGEKLAPGQVFNEAFYIELY